MKDFDAELLSSPEEDRRFRFYGHEFTRRRSVKPETLAKIEDLYMLESSAEHVKALDEIIILFLVPEDAEKWRALREPDDSPVTTHDMRALMEWMMEEDARLPTRPSSDSQDGAGDTERSSTEPSGSEGAIRAA